MIKSCAVRLLLDQEKTRFDLMFFKKIWTEAEYFLRYKDVKFGNDYLSFFKLHSLQHSQSHKLKTIHHWNLILQTV